MTQLFEYVCLEFLPQPLRRRGAVTIYFGSPMRIITQACDTALPPDMRRALPCRLVASNNWAVPLVRASPCNLCRSKRAALFRSLVQPTTLVGVKPRRLLGEAEPRAQPSCFLRPDGRAEPSLTSGGKAVSQACVMMGIGDPRIVARVPSGVWQSPSHRNSHTFRVLAIALAWQLVTRKTVVSVNSSSICGKVVPHRLR